MAIKEVYLNSDHEFEFDVKRKATTTGNIEAAAGLSGAQAWFSATDGGSALGSTTTSLSERSATAGRIYGILDAATLASALTASLNSVVYEVLSIPGDDLRSEPYVVKSVARPG